MNNRGNNRYNKWQEYEDDFLLKLVAHHGCKKWNVISQFMKIQYNIHKRTGKQCRERWLNLQSYSHELSAWSPKDDKKLFQLYKLHGTKWSVIVKHFQGRGDNYIKNRFYSLIRKSIRQMCKYSNVKTSALNIYSIKPATISHIFSEGLNALEKMENNHFRGEQQKHIFDQQNYKELTQAMILFIFKDFRQEQLKIQKSKVIEVLQRIMKIQASLDEFSHDKETQNSSDCQLMENDLELNKISSSKAKSKKGKLIQIELEPSQQVLLDEIIAEEQNFHEEFESQSLSSTHQQSVKYSEPRLEQQAGKIQQKLSEQILQGIMISLPSQQILDRVKYDILLEGSKDMNFQFIESSSLFSNYLQEDFFNQTIYWPDYYQ